MSFTHTQVIQYQTAGRTLVKSYSLTGGSQTSVSESIPDSSTDELVNFTLDVSTCTSFYMASDQDMTIETNSGGSPIDTIVLVADVPYIWNTDSYDSFLLGTDVTALYATNASGSAATLEVEALFDPTP